MGIHKNLTQTKNPKYIEAATDPKTNHWVKDAYRLHYSKLNRPIWSQVWNYYRHRDKLTFKEFLIRNKGATIRITWAGPPPPDCNPQTILTINEETYPDLFNQPIRIDPPIEL